MSTEEIEHIISIIGEEKSERLYQYLKDKRISFSPVHKYLLLNKNLALVISKKAVQLIAKQLKVARTTIYSWRKKYGSNNNYSND